VTITETHVINLNDCNVGTILRTFTATDASGNTATCTQLVTVSNPDPFDESDITWPPSPVSVDICNSTDPEDIPNGEPVIDPNALLCADLDIMFTDVVVINVDNNPNTPCQIITRTWTITDNCQMNATFTFVQTINVQDMVPPLFTNINDMTKVANAMTCTASFTLIASATDCAGVSITNDSPYGVNNGANASGNYPIGVTVVTFTGTDGCGNTSTMDVVITVTDPDPADMMCEKVIFILPPELEITINAKDFTTIITGACSTEDDFIVSYSGTDPFDTLNTYDCGDVGVSTFSLWLWTADGSMIIDTCTTADLDLRDPEDLCMDGFALGGDVKNETGLPIDEVEVSIWNAPMVPDTSDENGHYKIFGLQPGTGYEVRPFHDHLHRSGVSTLDLVVIQKHLLGRTKLSSPYQMIAADANRNNMITVLDLLEIRKLILGIYSRFPDNTSWRFVDLSYEFPDPYNPFSPGFPETVWMDSVTHDMEGIDFVGIKVGDVNGSYFNQLHSGTEIGVRSSDDYLIRLMSSAGDMEKAQWTLQAEPGQGEIEGLQFSLYVGSLSSAQVSQICSDIIPQDQWHYDPATGTITVSWTPANPIDVAHKSILCGPPPVQAIEGMRLVHEVLAPEVYRNHQADVTADPVVLISEGIILNEGQAYELHQNIPNPFNEGTLIRFTLPADERVILIVHDVTGRQVSELMVDGHSGLNQVKIGKPELRSAGIYYYTLKTMHASLTRKMSFTSN
jgi:hypothetical protein